MRYDVASTVHAILRRGVSLRESLENGEPVQLELERAALEEQLGLLSTEEIWEAGEDGETALEFHNADQQEERSRLSQATIRYALTCWLDEFLSHYSSLGETWRAYSLESVLFGTSEAGERFWEEARFAEIRGDAAALDVIYWCVLLGFRGAWRDRPAQIEAWAARVRAILTRPAARDESAPLDWASLVPEAPPPSDLSYRRMLFTAMVSLSLLLSLGLFILTRE
jgi:type IV/VI secretion system ImpK/VasF family protein